MAQNETGAKTIINNGFLEKYMASAPTAYTLVYIYSAGYKDNSYCIG